MQRRVRGFTLVELMVAIAVLAVMGSMSWLGLDALLRSKSRAQEHATATAALQVALNQWALDLDQAVYFDGIEPMAWDGKVFRLTRRMAEPDNGLQVTAWAVQIQQGKGSLQRWQSGPVVSVQQWKNAWQEAAGWAGVGATARAVDVVEASHIEVAFWSRSSGAWIDAQLAQTGEPTEARKGVLKNVASTSKIQPLGVQLRIKIGSGVIEKNWVSPQWTVTRS